MTKLILRLLAKFPSIKLLSLCLIACLAASRSSGADTYNLIHAFKGGDKDGRMPIYSSLIASGNILYGVTQDGGKNSNGVLFEVESSGANFNLLHTFNGLAILNPNGSTNDGALPNGTPVLDTSTSTLYGMTTEGGSNGYVGGTIYEIGAGGSNFRLLHSFGGLGDGLTPFGSLILSGTTLYGMTTAGGTNIGDDEGTIFTIQTDGSGYHVLQDFQVSNIGQGSPYGSLLQWGTTLYGMTLGGIFQMETDGSDFIVVHPFTGAPSDGASPYGSLVRQGSYIYGMTSKGGLNNYGTVFQINLLGSKFLVIHNFAMTEANTPFGDLVFSGSTLYGMTWLGGDPDTGEGTVFQIDTNGGNYDIIHTFQFPKTYKDGGLPYGSPMILGSQLFGMTALGGSFGLPLGSSDGGTIFALTLPGGSGGSTGPTPAPPTLTITSPTANETDAATTLTVNGTTKDNVAVTGVVVTLNGNDLPIATTDSYLKWTAHAAAANFPPGTNTISAYAMSSGGSSPTKTVSFFHKVTEKLNGMIVGKGTLTQNEFGKELVLYDSYTMKAVPAAKYEFTSWTLTVNGTSTTVTTPKMTFQMVPNLTITATFTKIP
jgi:uncharacterized repeat protein (TIGR03803 family)